MQLRRTNWLEDARIATGIIAIGAAASGVLTTQFGESLGRTAAYIVIIFAILQSVPLIWRWIISRL
jgi:hypothetical protein